jgi:hypothetical protein
MCRDATGIAARPGSRIPAFRLWSSALWELRRTRAFVDQRLGHYDAFVRAHVDGGAPG